MPLPLIPALFLGGSIVAGLKGFIDTTSAISEMQTLREDYQKRRAQYEQHERRYKEYWHLVEEHWQALGRLRLQALVTLSEAAKLLKKARLKDRNLFEEFKASPDQLTISEIESLKAIEVLDGTAKSVSAGVATATAVYGLAQAIGTASTGTAISTLSGAAATNATLAWLGGGALAAGGGGMALGTSVLGGLVTGPALLAAGFFMSEKLEKVKTEVAKQMAEMDVAESAMEKQMDELAVICPDRRVAESNDEVPRHAPRCAG